MKQPPAIDSILILTGTEYKERASLLFKKYFFSKTKSLDALLTLQGLNKIWVKDAAFIEELGEIVEKRITEFANKSLEASALLREQEWNMIGKLSGVTADFSLYTNRSSGVFGTTRVYLAYRDPEDSAPPKN